MLLQNDSFHKYIKYKNKYYKLKNNYINNSNELQLKNKNIHDNLDEILNSDKINDSSEESNYFNSDEEEWKIGGGLKWKVKEQPLPVDASQGAVLAEAIQEEDSTQQEEESQGGASAKVTQQVDTLPGSTSAKATPQGKDSTPPIDTSQGATSAKATPQEDDSTPQEEGSKPKVSSSSRYIIINRNFDNDNNFQVMQNTGLKDTYKNACLWISIYQYLCICKSESDSFTSFIKKFIINSSSTKDLYSTIDFNDESISDNNSLFNILKNICQIYNINIIFFRYDISLPVEFIIQKTKISHNTTLESYIFDSLTLSTNDKYNKENYLLIYVNNSHKGHFELIVKYDKYDYNIISHMDENTYSIGESNYSITSLNGQFKYDIKPDINLYNIKAHFLSLVKKYYENFKVKIDNFVDSSKESDDINNKLRELLIIKNSLTVYYRNVKKFNQLKSYSDDFAYVLGVQQSKIDRYLKL
jgi:cell division septation protein DedD